MVGRALLLARLLAGDLSALTETVGFGGAELLFIEASNTVNLLRISSKPAVLSDVLLGRTLTADNVWLMLEISLDVLTL